VKRDVAALASREHELLVIGGGIYGVTATYEAASRGLRVALVEAHDFGGGASWNSLKTVHGGLRHLQRLDLASHRESVRERRLLLAMAPEIVRPMRFLVPAYGHGRKGREALSVGLLFDNLLGLDRNAGLAVRQRLEAGRMLGRDAAVALVPGLSQEGLAGAAVWSDAQMESSERLTLGFLRAAGERGATAANYCPALGLLQEGGRVRGARVMDAESGQSYDVRAACVLLAAGPRAAQALLPSLRPVPQLLAMNLVLEGPWPLRERLGVGARSGGRFLFLVPWRDHLLAGTDYQPAAEAPDRPGTAAGAEGAGLVQAFRADVARAFPWAGIEGRRVTLVHRGGVPGESGPDGLWTRPLVVDQAKSGGPAGLITLQGVKYTTARAVSERAVRLACCLLGRSVEGADGTTRGRSAPKALVWARPLQGSLAERTRAAVRDEMACTLNDAALRRLDLGTTGPPPVRDVDEVARVMADELGWDEGRMASEKQALARFYEDAYNGTEGC
jgi:glycerol-3-phosphate dehydrogenase